ncbi:hypothetical protein FA95DRAFT_857538 [Auriscalpium vulgare]|uniref:Uncharacterized protein n=1 Tax=Auriscalpium vulgare TaxID=40419 RepID=A0ACB8RZN4_9AGAM|nr:hypothetical protein FA95DRAFT_857538 [Auriscalpium vulgare]
MKLMVETLEMGKNLRHPDNSVRLHHSAARVLSDLAHVKFVHHHGERGARLSAGQSVYGCVANQRSKAFNIVNIILAGRPRKSLEKLESVSIDGIFSYSPWQQYVAKEMERWKSITMKGALFITGNLAFLAIPSVIDSSDNGGSASQTTGTVNSSSLGIGSPMTTLSIVPSTHGSLTQTWSGAQVLSAVSCIMFMTSILNSFILSELYSSKHGSEFRSAIKFHSAQSKISGVFKGLEAMAILQSFPLAWLLWGGIFSVMSFIAWSTEPKHTVIALLAAIGVALIAFTGLLWLRVIYPEFVGTEISDWLRTHNPAPSLSLSHYLRPSPSPSPSPSSSPSPSPSSSPSTFPSPPAMSLPTVNMPQRPRPTAWFPWSRSRRRITSANEVAVDEGAQMEGRLGLSLSTVHMRQRPRPTVRFPWSRPKTQITTANEVAVDEGVQTSRLGVGQSGYPLGHDW